MANGEDDFICHINATLQRDPDRLDYVEDWGDTLLTHACEMVWYLLPRIVTTSTYVLRCRHAARLSRTPSPQLDDEFRALHGRVGAVGHIVGLLRLDVDCIG
jgi:hypothetical protein